eukprot:jgi/Mesvir1/16211/Mv08469-RA.1
MTRLAIEAGRGDEGGLLERLEAGDDVNAADGVDERTALHEAAAAGHVDIMGVLFRHGARVDVQSKTGNTPLHLAAWNGRDQAVRLLLTHGANAGLRTQSGNTPLHWAAKHGHVAVVALLAQAGHAQVCLSVQNNDGDTPLHLACRLGHREVVQLLMAAGASGTVANMDGKTPSQLGPGLPMVPG